VVHHLTQLLTLVVVAVVEQQVVAVAVRMAVQELSSFVTQFNSFNVNLNLSI
jgi:hypothetical protein